MFLWRPHLLPVDFLTSPGTCDNLHLCFGRSQTNNFQQHCYKKKHWSEFQITQILPSEICQGQKCVTDRWSDRQQISDLCESACLYKCHKRRNKLFYRELSNFLYWLRQIEIIFSSGKMPDTLKLVTINSELKKNPTDMTWTSIVYKGCSFFWR